MIPRPSNASPARAILARVIHIRATGPAAAQPCSRSWRGEGRLELPADLRRLVGLVLVSYAAVVRRTRRLISLPRSRSTIAMSY